MDYKEFLETRQLLKKLYHDIGAARKSNNIQALVHIHGTITQWLRSINNPKLYYVYEPQDYLTNPHLMRLRKEFPDILRLVDLAKKDIQNKVKEAAMKKLARAEESIPKEVDDAADSSIQEEIQEAIR